MMPSGRMFLRTYLQILFFFIINLPELKATKTVIVGIDRKPDFKRGPDVTVVSHNSIQEKRYNIYSDVKKRIIYLLKQYIIITR